MLAAERCCSRGVGENMAAGWAASPLDQGSDSPKRGTRVISSEGTREWLVWSLGDISCKGKICG
jgi:hypothetical protein